MRIKVILSLSILAALAVPDLGYAAPPSVLCISNTGTLVLRAGKCRKSEAVARIDTIASAIDSLGASGSSATGPIGSQGVPGPIGATGALGPSGPIGPTGAQGPTGQVGPQGPVGPSGPSGSKGATGAQGPAGLVGRQLVTSPLTVTLISGGDVNVVAACPLSKVAVGGGCVTSDTNVLPLYSAPADGIGSIYGCLFRNRSAGSVTATLTATVVCVNIAP